MFAKFKIFEKITFQNHLVFNGDDSTIFIPLRKSSFKILPKNEVNFNFYHLITII